MIPHKHQGVEDRLKKCWGSQANYCMRTVPATQGTEVRPLTSTSSSPAWVTQ